MTSNPDIAGHDAMGAALVERGVLTQDQVNQSRANLEAQLTGVAPEPRDAPNAAEPKPVTDQSPVVARAQDGSLDQAIFAPPASPAAYNFLPDGLPHGEEQDLAFEQSSREALHYAGGPVGLANQMAKLWNDAMSREMPTDAQLVQARQEAHAQLTKMWGDQTQANINLARGVLAKMAEKNPALPELLTLSGLGNNPWLVSALANIGKARGGR
jgi:hypothetical protein